MTSEGGESVRGQERLERGGNCSLFETEVNGDSKGTDERGPSLVGSLGNGM
jgi:hypothetical protein